MNRNKAYKASIFVLVIVCVTMFFVLNIGGLTDDDATKNELLDLAKIESVSGKREVITKSIKQLGPQETFDVLKREFINDYGNGHTALHLFGEELFKHMGESGVEICDSSLGFGCFHGFSTRALSEGGDAALLKLEEACNKKFPNEVSPCLHGLGHGVLEYYGHSNVVSALEACSKLNWSSKIFGCKDGIFMEYNFPNLLDSPESLGAARSFDEEAPYDICPSLPGDYKLPCYYSLPQWWSFHMNSDYEKMGNLCRGIKEEIGKKACYLGIGIIVPLGYNFDSSVSLKEIADECMKMPYEEAEARCRTAIRGLMVGGEHVRNNADEACNGLTENLRKSCIDTSFYSEIEYYDGEL